MSIILAIETATKVCSIAVSSDGSVTGEMSLSLPHVHVDRLVTMVRDLLANTGLKYADLDAVAVSNGPGSFTGLRIGLSVAKGIAFASEKKLISVPTLDALAMRVRDREFSGLVIPVLHARGNEFYYSSYKIVNSRPEKSGTYKVADALAIAEEFDKDVVFVGEGVAELVKYETVTAKFDRRSFENLSATAVDVALLADEKFRRGEFSELKSLVPMYIKDFVAVKGNPLNKIMERI